MTFGNGGKVTIPDGLVKIIAYTVAILGVGYGVARQVNEFDNRTARLEARFETFIFDICSHIEPGLRAGYRSCVDNPTPPYLQSGAQ